MTGPTVRRRLAAAALVRHHGLRPLSVAAATAATATRTTTTTPFDGFRSRWWWLSTSSVRRLCRMPASTFDRILGSAVLAAEKAGQVARDVLEGGNLGIVEKSGGADDLQTAADRAANRIILLSLRRAVPGLRVIGEEGEEEQGPLPEAADAGTLSGASDSHGIVGRVPEEYEAAALEDFTVWVDPLDATKEYSEGFLHHVTVLVGIALKDKAVAGVIHQPFFEADGRGPQPGRTIYGVVGAAAPAVVGLPGVGGGGQREPSGERVCVTSRSHNNKLVEEALAAIQPSKVIRVGGAGYKVLLLVEGDAGAYVFPSPGCKKWDTCAPEAVLHAAGGKLTDIRGVSYAYGPDAPVPDEWGVLATAREQDHEWYLGAIPSTVKEAVKSYGLKK